MKPQDAPLHHLLQLAAHQRKIAPAARPGSRGWRRGLVAGVGGDEVEREALEDLAVGAAAAALHGLARWRRRGPGGPGARRAARSWAMVRSSVRRGGSGPAGRGGGRPRRACARPRRRNSHRAVLAQLDRKMSQVGGDGELRRVDGGARRLPRGGVRDPAGVGVEPQRVRCRGCSRRAAVWVRERRVSIRAGMMRSQTPGS